MKLILITSDSPTTDESALITTLFEHGLEQLHLRKLELDGRAMRAYLKVIPNHFHSRIVLHSHHRLALSFKVGGIHLTRVHQRRKLRNRIRLTWLKIRRPGILVSVSCYKLAHLYANNQKYSFALLGPIYDQQHNKFSSGFSTVSLETALRKNPLPVIARGGIDFAHVEQLRELRFAGIAVSHQIWSAEDPLAEFLRYQQACHFVAPSSS